MKEAALIMIIVFSVERTTSKNTNIMMEPCHVLTSLSIIGSDGRSTP